MHRARRRVGTNWTNNRVPEESFIPEDLVSRPISNSTILFLRHLVSSAPKYDTLGEDS